MDWQEFYEQLKDSSPEKRGVQVQEFVQERADYEEDHHVELKRCNYATGKVTKETKGDLAQEASAFANAAGGLIIWGFDDDRAPVHISDAEGAARKLHSLGGECTRPAIDGIETIPALAKGKEKEGYAVTYVPHSQTAPHQAAMGGPKINGKYFRRRGDRSPHMEHAELDDMFGRRPRPDLVPELRFRGCECDRKAWVRCDIRNYGRGTALAVTITVKLTLVHAGTGKPTERVPKYGVKGYFAIPFAADPFVPPDSGRIDAWIPLDSRPIPSVDGHSGPFDIEFNWGNCLAAKAEERADLRFEWRLGAYGMRTREGRFVLSVNETVAQMIKNLPVGALTRPLKGVAGQDVQIDPEDLRRPLPF